MSKLARQIQLFSNALARLKEVEQPRTVIERDAMVQRFEFTFDMGWKTLKTILFEHYSVEAPTAPQAFQEAVRVGILDDTQPWVQLRETRNKTSHMYSEALAEEVARAMPAFIIAFDTLAVCLEKIK